MGRESSCETSPRKRRLEEQAEEACERTCLGLSVFGEVIKEKSRYFYLVQPESLKKLEGYLHKQITAEGGFRAHIEFKKIEDLPDGKSRYQILYVPNGDIQTKPREIQEEAIRDLKRRLPGILKKLRVVKL